MENTLENLSKDSINSDISDRVVVRKSRQTGFEILRIISLFLICCVHIMNYGGILGHAEGVQLTMLRLLYSVFLVAVNVFVLISGYFMIKSNFKFTKALCLWGQVIFYCVVSYLLSLIILEDAKFDLNNFVKCFFPFIYKKYWFFAAYMALYLVSPVLKEILNKLSRKQYTILLIALFLLTYLLTRRIKLTIDVLGSGYSSAWFVVLFAFGGYFRLYPPKINKIWIFLIYLVCTLSVFGMWYWTDESIWVKLLYNTRGYTSPLVLIASVCVLLLFKDIRIKNNFAHSIICFVSSCTFGIYLFHCSSIQPYIFFNILKCEKYYGSKYSPLFVLGGALAIFLMGLVAEFVRKFIVWICNITIKKLRLAVDDIKRSKNNKVSVSNTDLDT